MLLTKETIEELKMRVARIASLRSAIYAICQNADEVRTLADYIGGECERINNVLDDLAEDRDGGASA